MDMNLSFEGREADRAVRNHAGPGFIRFWRTSI